MIFNSNVGSFLNPGSGGYGAAFEKAVMHGIVRAGMAKLQGQKVSAGFWSGFVASGFAAPKSWGIKEGTFVNAVVGGTTSELTGGKFANGAVTGAFIYLFNERMSKYELELMRKQATARASAYEKAFGEEAHSYMFDKPKTVIAIYKVGGYALSFAAGMYLKVAELYGLGSRAAITAGAVGTMTGASIGYESYKGLGVSDPEEFMENKLMNGVNK